DGIRDFHVTGVQTCALPISLSAGGAWSWCICDGSLDPLGAELVAETTSRRSVACGQACCVNVTLPDASTHLNTDAALALAASTRSEERRVGRECKSLWQPGL